MNAHAGAVRSAGRIAGWFHRALSIVRAHRKAYIVLNVAYYGLVAIAMVLVSAHPAMQQMLTQAVLQSFTQGPLSSVADAYGGGRVLTAIALTFGFNLFLGSVAALLAPSLIIPFGGVAAGMLRAVMWGLLLAPTTPELRAAMIPHSLTLLLEGQGYILAILAAWVFGRAFVSPSSAGAATWLKGYAAGLKQALWLYLLVALVLLVAAIYEAIEVIYLVPLLLPG